MVVAKLGSQASKKNNEGAVKTAEQSLFQAGFDQKPVNADLFKH